MQKTAFNDNWKCNGKEVLLPHDAMIHTPRTPDAESGSAQAYFSGGSYVYEKVFEVSEEMLQKHIVFEFEGVYKKARVYINGKEAGGADYGYIPFFVPADGLLVKGKNTIRVTCDNKDQPDSRWYSGAGIYRPVWMHMGSGNCIEPESVRIVTVSYDPAVIRIISDREVNVEITDGSAAVASGSGADFELEIPKAKLWSDISPFLYTCRAYTDTDECEFRFGIRKIEWNRWGLFINGRRTLLRGGCIHHDNGILGAATYDESEFRKAKKIKNAGFNAIRSAHNPVSRAMLEACDALGLYVMDEAWDMWYNHKNKYDYALKWQENHFADLDAMVKRDYNHPCVIMYSIGNEVSEPATGAGVTAAQEMIDHLHSMDPSRAVTAGINLMILKMAKGGKGIYNDKEGGRNSSADSKTNAMNSTVFNLMASFTGTAMNGFSRAKSVDKAVSPVLGVLDIAGYNYASGRYPLEFKAHPDRIIVGSETFPQDIVKNWNMVKKYPYLVGDFMWTAWDYLGEVGLGAWAYTDDGKGFDKPYPWLLADCGAFDILGNAGAPVAYARSAWGLLKKPWIGVQPVNHNAKPAKAAWRGSNAIESWSWKNCAGKKAAVEVYTDAASVELFINSKSVGKKKTKRNKAVFQVKYEPGAVKAVAYDRAGNAISENTLVSAGDASVCVLPEKRMVTPNEIFYVNIVIADENSTVECNADEKVKVTVSGGDLLAFGSANPRTEERFDSGEYTTYYGRALAAIRAGDHGVLTVTANGVSADIEIK